MNAVNQTKSTLADETHEYAVFALDTDGNVASWNEGAERVLGYKHHEILGKHFSCFYLEADCRSGRAQLVLSRPIDEGWGANAGWRVRKNGSKFWAESAILTLRDGFNKVRGFVKIVRDMTERRKLEEAWTATNARLAGILDIAEDGIISVDGDQKITLFNVGAERMFGYTAKEVIGKPLEMLLPIRFSQNHRRQVEEFVQSGVTARRMGERGEVLGRRKDGSEFPTETSISKLELQGNITLTAILRDVTARRRAEEEIRRLNEVLEQRVRERTSELQQTNEALETTLGELQSRNEEVRGMTQQLWQAAKLASVGELAAGIAHELNNPLATISLRVESVLARTPESDERRRMLEIIQQETKRMGDLVTNLLQFSRRSSDAVSTVEVPDELLKAIDLVQHQMKQRMITVVHEFAPNTPTIYADRQKLRQVFLNLLTNACDAMHHNGGTLTLRAAPDTLDGRDAVRIEFTDTGAGISSENLPKIFEPFFTTKEEGKGTGLGLAICRRVIQEHRGSLTILSEVGKGSTVTVLLPFKDDVNVTSVRRSRNSK